MVVTAIDAPSWLFAQVVPGRPRSALGPVTVYLCSGQRATCDAMHPTQIFSGLAVGANGDVADQLDQLRCQGNWYASATQTDAAGNVGTSEVVGPIPN